MGMRVTEGGIWDQAARKSMTTEQQPKFSAERARELADEYTESDLSDSETSRYMSIIEHILNVTESGVLPPSAVAAAVGAFHDCDGGMQACVAAGAHAALCKLISECMNVSQRKRERAYTGTEPQEGT